MSVLCSGLAAQFVTDNPGPILTGDKSAKPQNFLIYLGKTAQGYLAASSQSPTHGAFSLNTRAVVKMMQRLHEFDQIRSAGKTFNSQRTLPYCRQTQFRAQ